ncbi:hypothetical protein [Aureimonas phyllosphaerae]|uniref:Uncharacterized protein n=1 Tax=Aureimonas phyllosphaerae TaxID=1166078 RepID=A0A7W6BYA8_9HYPH|nr:hypothetical protein [Aureimonas phyllosphaerae]MBB3937363.1 hypothetical protein [Aureimonas phyllosphaerae]MBB3961370.1 hypothetical protein [Aureimonas phyllosphaerae]
MAYERIGYGPELEYAKAECEIRALGTEQGYAAYGSAAFVLGSAIGNAIDNEVRKSGFMRNCMTLQGWRQVPRERSTAATQEGTIAPAVQQRRSAPRIDTSAQAFNRPGYRSGRCFDACLR